MKQRKFTLFLLLVLLCSTLPADAVRVRTKSVNKKNRLELTWPTGKQKISEFTTGIPYFAEPDVKNPGAIFNTHVDNGYDDVKATSYFDLPDWAVCYAFRPDYITGYINGSTMQLPLPNYAQITKVYVPVLFAPLYGDTENYKNTMNVKTYVKTILLEGEDKDGNPTSDSDFFDYTVNCNRDSLLNRMWRAKEDTYVSTADHEEHSGFGTTDDSEHWSRPAKEHPEDFIHANLSRSYTWTYDYNNYGIMFMWDIRNAQNVRLTLPTRDEDRFDDRWSIFRDNALYAGKGKGMLNDTVFEPLLASVGFEENFTPDEEHEQDGYTSFSFRLGGEKTIGNYDNTTEDIPRFHNLRDNSYFSPVANGGSLSFVINYYTNDIFGKVLDYADSNPIVDVITEDQPHGRPLVRLYDVTARKYIAPPGKTLNKHNSCEVEEDGTYEFQALNPTHEYQLSFASYSYGYYELYDLFFDKKHEFEKNSSPSLLTSDSPGGGSSDEPGDEPDPGYPGDPGGTTGGGPADGPTGGGSSEPGEPGAESGEQNEDGPDNYGKEYFDQSSKGKIFDIEVILLLSKNGLTTGVANPGTGREVSRVRYFNTQGYESQQPHSGINVVVTEYSDGSKSTEKKVIP